MTKAPKVTTSRGVLKAPRVVSPRVAHPGALPKTGGPKGGFGWNTVKTPKSSPFTWKPTPLGRGRPSGRRGK